jgi:phosphate transport system permease protein
MSAADVPIDQQPHPLEPRGTVARLGDPTFRILVTAFAGLLLATLGLIVIETTAKAWPFIHAHGGTLVTSTDWSPARGTYGGLVFVYGTLLSAAVAVLLAVPTALGIAFYLNEAAPARVRQPLIYMVELLAAVPSVVYGLWGFVVLVPFLADNVWPELNSVVGWIPLLGGPPSGVSIATAGVILALMIVPIITAICREALSLVPPGQKEAAVALGATRWETIRHALIPYALSGIVGAVVLGLGRAMGETIAVALLIGSAPRISDSIFKPGYAMASVIANEFPEATGDHVNALIAIGVLLFAITIVVNIAAQLFVRKSVSALR